MTLDIEFRKLLETELEKTLKEIPRNDTDLSKIWNCKHEDDFLYGWHLGKAEDFCTNQYFIYYHKTPSREDKDEIQGILFLHAKDFRDRLTKH